MKSDRQKRREYFRKQKLFGLLVMTVAILSLCTLTALGERDCGMLLLGIPAGLYLIFTKEMVMDFSYKLELDKGNKQKAL